MAQGDAQEEDGETNVEREQDEEKVLGRDVLYERMQIQDAKDFALACKKRTLRKHYSKPELAELVKQTLYAHGRKTNHHSSGMADSTDANDTAAEVLNRRTSCTEGNDASKKKKRVINEHMSIREFMENQSTKVTVGILDRVEQEWRKYREEKNEDEHMPVEVGYLERREFLNKVEERGGGGEKRSKITILKEKKKRKF